jgi:hypothetical protein
MDFAKTRGGHGPGRMSRAQALEHIALRDGEEFGEDTGLAFDPRSGYAAMQYNHFGPRERSIEEYLYAFDLSLGGLRPLQDNEHDEDRCGFEFGAVLKRDAYARLRRFGIIHDIDFTIARLGVDREDLAAGRSLSAILNAPLPDGIDILSVTLKAEQKRSSSLGMQRARQLIEDLRRLGTNVTKARVRGKRTDEDTLQKVDLIEERISSDVALTLRSGRRYSRIDRWNALSDTLHDWLNAGVLRTVE